MRFRLISFGFLLTSTLMTHSLFADGFLRGKSTYEGSLAEKSQEAILIYDSTAKDKQQEMILKIAIQGKVDQFAWIIPFPAAPKVHKANIELFRELYDHVTPDVNPENRKGKFFGGGGALGGGVEVISREVVGTYDVAVVQEHEAGMLNEWLKKEKFQTIENGDDILEFYRRKKYVYACIKVNNPESQKEMVDFHPLRFSFQTGSHSAIYFPMKLTSLQEVPFNVNLYVLSKESLLEKENRFGYTHQHFSLNHKSIIRLNQPPRKLPNTFEQLKKLGFENHFFLTNIKGRFDPKKVRKWQDDLWLFPLNQSKGETPEDAKIGGVAADGYVVEETSDN